MMSPILFSRMIAADGIVPGSPVSIDNVTGQMKVFIYRLADAMFFKKPSGILKRKTHA